MVIGACSAESRSDAPAAAADSVSARLELVATIDPGDTDPFLNVTSLALDGDGNVYVLDQGARNIRVFDSTGAPVRTIGREGQGPAEFGRPYSLAWVGDTLAVFDPGNGRIELVTRTGMHAATWRGSRISGPQVRLWQSGPSRIFLDSYRPAPDGRMQMLYVSAGPQGGRDTLVIPERTDADAVTAVTCRGQDGGVYWFDVPFASRRVLAVSPEGYLVVARTGDYRFIWIDPAGTPRRIMAFGADTLRIPDAFWDSVQAEYATWRGKLAGAECDPSDLPRPARKEVFRAVEFDDQGRLWVEAATETGYRFDMWEAAQGRRVGSFASPERNAAVPFVVRSERLVLVSQEDAQSVSIYRVVHVP